jgi:hypothetical protein
VWSVVTPEPGRPPIGPRIPVRLYPEQHDRIAEEMKLSGRDRSEEIRALIDEALAARRRRRERVGGS